MTPHDRIRHEQIVRERLGQKFQTEFKPASLQVGMDGSKSFKYAFDGVSKDESIVIEVKSNRVRRAKNPKGRWDSAIKQAVCFDMLRLSMLRHQKHIRQRILVLTDRKTHELCRDEFGWVAKELGVEIHFEPIP